MFKAKGILPLAYGDRDGYSTDNWVTHDYASYMAKGDIAKVDAGKMKYADPKLVKPLEALAQFKKQGCVNPDASTHENNDANTYFTSGKAAMVLMFPFVIKDFEKALGKNLGLARLPQSGPNPGRHRLELLPQLGDPEERGATRTARGSSSRWRWTDRAASELATKVGALCRPTRPRAEAQGSAVEVLPAAAANPQVPLLDSVVPAEGRAALLPAAPGGVLG